MSVLQLSGQCPARGPLLRVGEGEGPRAPTGVRGRTVCPRSGGWTRRPWLHCQTHWPPLRGHGCHCS